MDYLKRKNKKGMIGILFFFIILITILVIGFVAVMLSGVISFASDTITPVMKDIGVVGDTNLSEASTVTFGVVDTIINAIPWLIVFAYILALIFSIILVMGYNYNPNPAFIVFYIALVLLLIIFSIIMSNMYQDIYEGTDEIALKLQDQVAMSYLILYSPFIMVTIALITGIFLFAGNREVTVV